MYEVLSLGSLSEFLEMEFVRPCLPLEIITRDDSESIRFVDVGHLQAQNPGCMFQAASNFNGVESPNPDVSPDKKNFCTHCLLFTEI